MSGGGGGWRRAADAVWWGSFTSRNSEVGGDEGEKGFANFVLAGIKKGKFYWPNV